MESKIIRKYNSEFRKKLVNNLENNFNNIPLIDIYNIIIEDINYNYSTNRNGIFINFNILSDNCINKLILLLEQNKNQLSISNKIDHSNTSNYKFDDVEIITELGHKLTNQEKIYIKKIKRK